MTETVETDIVRPSLVDILKYLVDILEGITITNNTDTLVKIYMEPYNLLVKRLDEEKELRGLMSQAVVPDLIQKMAKISKKNKNEITLDHLYNQLTNPTKDNPPQADYPYSRTRILEMLVEIHGNSEEVILSSLPSSLPPPPPPPKANLAKFKDPLLGAAVRIADNMAKGGKVKLELGNPEWVQKFSTAVNQIQDVIVRHMIFAREHLIPLMGDDSIPTPEVALLLSKDVKETRALGLGENPNPEMAAILNPALVMSKEERGRYLRELGLLSSLISPQQDIDWDKKLKGVFGYAGFEFSEGDGGAVDDGDGEIGGDDGDVDDSPLRTPRSRPGSPMEEDPVLLNEIKNLEAQLAKEKIDHDAALAECISRKEEILILQAETDKTILFLKEKIETVKTEAKDLTAKVPQLNQAIIDLGTKNKTLTDEVAQLQLLLTTESGTLGTSKKKEVNYKLKALNHLISYLGVDPKLPQIITTMLEINALSGLDAEQSKNEINKKLIEWIRGTERLTVLRKNKTTNNYAVPMTDDGSAYVAMLFHAEIITAWKAAKPETTGLPDETDLFFVKMHLGKEGNKIKTDLEAELEKKKKDLAEELEKKKQKLALGIGSNISTAGYTKKLKTYPNNLVHRKKQNRRGAGDRVLVW